MPLPEYWKGSLITGRQGLLRIRLKEDSDGHIQGDLILIDYLFGPSWSSFNGSLRDSHADLTLGDFRTLAPVSASSGKVSINFDLANRVANGDWQTDLATGRLAIGAVNMSRLRWWWWNLLSGVFLLLPRLYGLSLAVLFVISANGRVTLSAPLLILALIPAPFLFQRYIARVVAIFGIQALGPVQLGSQKMPTLVGPLFASLDSYLALQSKTLLILLADQPEGTTVEGLNKLAIRNNATEMQTELVALAIVGCVRVDGSTCQVTNLGRRYIAHCLEEDSHTPRDD